MSHKQLFCTLGDPLSINCEAILKLFEQKVFNRDLQIILIGSFWQLSHQAEFLNLPIPKMKQISSIDELTSSGVYFLDPLPKAGNSPPLKLSAVQRGDLSIAALRAIPKTSLRKFAVLTSPIDKAASVASGFPFSGQTEFFEDHWNQEAIMLLAGPKLRVGLVTNHIALKSVSAALKQELIVRKLQLLTKGLKETFGISHPKIAVCGLNPHCSDNGLFGDEESSIIKPAIVQFQNSDNSASVVGPVPADTAFYHGYHGTYDAVLAQYHDQGLGPLKALHFDTAVNITAGIHNLRVSPDHGPAADLYGTGKASMKSFETALNLCQSWLICT